MILRSTVLLSAAYALSTLAAPAACAQDDGAPEQPAAPATEPLMQFTDNDKTVALQLPRDWKVERPDAARGEVAKFLWPQGEGARALIVVSQNVAQMRAPLARYLATRQGEVAKDSEASGDGWMQVAVLDKGQARALYHRFVEKDGIVWQATFVCHTSTFVENRAVAEAALASLELRGTYKPPAIPSGWSESKLKEFVMWTDADSSNVGDAEKIVESLRDVREMAAKSLDGKPVDESPGLVKVVQNGTLFEELCMAGTGQKPDNAIFDASTRALLVKWMARNTQGFQDTLVQWAAAQYVHQYFGGDVPLWISGGVRMYAVYGAADGGKPQKPDKDRMRGTGGRPGVKQAVAGASRKLDAWFTTVSSDVPDMNVGFMELYAWHWFFRHAKQGKKYRKTYEQCLETLRATGDPAAAHAVWEGTDFAGMFDDFKKWGDSL